MASTAVALTDPLPNVLPMSKPTLLVRSYTEKDSSEPIYTLTSIGDPPDGHRKMRGILVRARLSRFLPALKELVKTHTVFTTERTKYVMHNNYNGTIVEAFGHFGVLRHHLETLLDEIEDCRKYFVVTVEEVENQA